ncbi:MAG: hypothetical protein CVU61_00005, partial [Deltaproteobacteria bacterium HGW-Deltaproteobacteria-19]
MAPSSSARPDSSGRQTRNARQVRRPGRPCTPHPSPPKEKTMSWQNLNLTWHYVEKWAAKKPKAEALVFGDERLTWADFKSRMDDIAKAFLEVGIRPGDRVALLSAARNEFLTTYMAAGKIGAMWLGLNPKFTLDELRYQVGDAKPAVLMAVRTF